jgi:valyl-tRNA synthetase
MKVGRRLATKLLNVSRFVLGLGPADQSAGVSGVAELSGVTEALDASMLATLAGVVEAATGAMDSYDYTMALEVTERFFWTFCDDYVELVKDRAYGREGESSAVPTGSARAALRAALSILLRLFAPVLPFATEEVWSWWRHGSVHAASWPGAHDFPEQLADPHVFSLAGTALSGIRSLKHARGLSLRSPLDRVVITAPPGDCDQLLEARADLVSAGKIEELTIACEPSAVEVAVGA